MNFDKESQIFLRQGGGGHRGGGEGGGEEGVKGVGK